MCPALILAARRKDKVNGRTKVLNVSIITRKGFNQLGACPGKSIAIKTIGEKEKDERIKANQIGRANDKDKNKCLLRLNV